MSAPQNRPHLFDKPVGLLLLGLQLGFELAVRGRLLLLELLLDLLLDLVFLLCSLVVANAGCRTPDLAADRVFVRPLRAVVYRSKSNENEILGDSHTSR